MFPFLEIPVSAEEDEEGERGGLRSRRWTQKRQARLPPRSALPREDADGKSLKALLKRHTATTSTNPDSMPTAFTRVVGSMPILIAPAISITHRKLEYPSTLLPD